MHRAEEFTSAGMQMIPAISFGNGARPQTGRIWRID